MRCGGVRCGGLRCGGVRWHGVRRGEESRPSARVQNKRVTERKSSGEYR